MQEDASLSTPLIAFGTCPVGHFWLLLDVLVETQSEGRIPAFGTGGCQTVHSV